MSRLDHFAHSPCLVSAGLTKASICCGSTNRGNPTAITVMNLLSGLFFVPRVLGPLNIIPAVACFAYISWYGIYLSNVSNIKKIPFWERRRFGRIEMVRRIRNGEIISILAAACVGIYIYLFLYLVYLAL